ncbi:MAG: hypothetical protein IPH09_11100 [bacterium]|nr:hypothetical protein [bacterium]
MLGLDNAATPLGLQRQRRGMQKLNPDPDTASDDQIMFLVINASSVTVLPVTIFTYRAQMGAADPTDVFIPNPDRDASAARRLGCCGHRGVRSGGGWPIWVLVAWLVSRRCWWPGRWR